MSSSSCELLRLSRNVHFKAHKQKVLRLPRHLHFEVYKVLRWLQSLRLEVCEGLASIRKLQLLISVTRWLNTSSFLRKELILILQLPRNLHFKVYRQSTVPATKSALQGRPPRHLHFNISKVLRLQQSLLQDSHRAALPRGFAARALPKTTSRCQNAAFAGDFGH